MGNGRNMDCHSNDGVALCEHTLMWCKIVGYKKERGIETIPIKSHELTSNKRGVCVKFIHSQYQRATHNLIELLAWDVHRV